MWKHEGFKQLQGLKLEQWEQCILLYSLCAVPGRTLQQTKKSGKDIPGWGQLGEILLCGERRKDKQTVFNWDREQKVSRGTFKKPIDFAGMTIEGEIAL